MDKVKLEEMTWPKIEEALARGKRTVIVPVGSLEQHGPHLPTGTDTFAGDVLGEKVAEALGDALVASTIRPGCSRHHMDFPGTITLTPETLMQTIKEVCRSLAAHGFQNIVLVPTQGGNFAPVNAVAPEIARELKGINIVAIANLEELITKMAEAMQEFNVSFEEAGAHSGASETSLIIAYKPELVNTGEFKKGYMGKFTSSALMSKGLKALSPIGVLGDPRKASREAGLKMIDKLASYYAQKIRDELRK
ncbi:MAG: Creatinine amidohydrolase [Candidatus Bathyarchaeota archaeon BA1]|nr:MAG: Creatinine amidohydrolase [Candidatus Bathyarchaeota archaeon BA1]